VISSSVTPPIASVGGVEHGPTAEHEGRSGDRTCGCDGDPSHEDTDPRVVYGLLEVARGDDDEQVTGKEHGERGDGRSERPRDEVADEGRIDASSSMRSP
jgi:hypothetical protein